MNNWDALERLGRLRMQGLLSEEEFAREKLKLFSGGAGDWSSDPEPEPKPAAAASRLRWLWLTLAGMALLAVAGGIGLLMAPAAIPVAHITGKNSVPDADADNAADGGNTVVPPPTATPASWKLPMAVSQLTKEERDAILRAAGYTLVNGKWMAASDDFGADQGCPAMLLDQLRDGKSPIRDLDGDGNPEVITTSNGSNCYGAVGTAFVILSWAPDGWHKLIDTTAGVPVFYPRTGSAWPDIELQGPGSCFRRLRWSGSGYSGYAGHSYRNKPCGDSAATPIVNDDSGGAERDDPGDGSPIAGDTPSYRQSQPGGVTVKRPSAPAAGTTGGVDSNAPW